MTLVVLERPAPNESFTAENVQELVGADAYFHRLRGSAPDPEPYGVGKVVEAALNEGALRVTVEASAALMPSGLRWAVDVRWGSRSNPVSSGR